MTNQSIRTILIPFLVISYVIGLRIVDLSSHFKLWFSLLYILLVWLTYYFLLTSPLISFFHKYYSLEYEICHTMELFTTLLSIVFGVYYDKRFRNCLKKLDIVDETLLKLGTITNYNKLRKKAIWLVLGWFVVVVLMNCATSLFIQHEFKCGIVTAMLLIFTRNYSFHINAIGDLTTASILAYIGLKFDQINKYLQDLTEDNGYGVKLTSKNLIIHSHRHRLSKALSNQYIIWTVIHLHLELRKISREIDTLLGIHMSFKMACYFGWIAIDLRIIFFAMLINNYLKTNKYICAVLHFIWLFHNVLKFLLINYVCETVGNKANTTGDLLNRISYFTDDVEIRKIISQFSLRTIYTPLRFCGIGFFQFGFKFLYRFIMSVATVSILLIQSYIIK